MLWEAQFGDFVNSAQVIIDQFIVSAMSKWGQSTRLTLLLPHGYEGSGPEHSSARMERFLQLAAEGNIRVANLTTPAQYFHLLRRQARVAKQRPLVIMTPKSLLRLPQATSRIEHLSESRFFPVLSEPRIDEEKVTRLVLCSGKIYYDLKGHATRENNESVAISRVELLYPFPQEQILDEVARYPNLREVAWVQEEPRNMGARTHMSPRLLQILPPAARVRLRRPARARLARRGLPGGAHDGAEPDHPHRARPQRAGVGQSDEAARRALARRASSSRTAAPAGANSGESRSSSVSQPGWTCAARSTASVPAATSPCCAIARPAQKSSSSDCGASSEARTYSAAASAARPSAAQLVAVARQLVGALEREQAAQLADRVGVVLDAQVQADLPRLALRRRDHQRGGLAAAHVAALGLGALERGHQPFGEVAAGGRERRRHRVGHRGPGHHVGLADPVLADRVTGLGDAVGAGVDGDAPARVDDADLAHRGERVRRQHARERLRRVLPAGEPVERVRAVRGLDDGLRRDGPDPRPDPGAQRADGEPVRLHRRSELAGLRVERDDRVRAVRAGHRRGTILP